MYRFSRPPCALVFLCPISGSSCPPSQHHHPGLLMLDKSRREEREKKGPKGFSPSYIQLLGPLMLHGSGERRTERGIEVAYMALRIFSKIFPPLSWCDRLGNVRIFRLGSFSGCFCFSPWQLYEMFTSYSSTPIQRNCSFILIGWRILFYSHVLVVPLAVYLRSYERGNKQTTWVV